MKSIGKWVIPASVALVAGVLWLVHAEHGVEDATGGAAAYGTSGSLASGTDKPLSNTGGGSTAANREKPAGASAPSEAPQAAPDLALYDVASLPKPVQAMLARIITAAQTGRLETMLPVLQSHEIPPLLTNAVTPDPLAYLKSQSIDGSGRDILAAMLNIFASGFAKQGSGKDTLYIWPYFATRDLRRLTPDQQVDLYRIVPAPDAAAMLKSGKYTFYRAGLSPDGAWHYFLR